MSSTFNRRSLLRGLGSGALLLSPFARSVEAWAAGQPAGGNFIFVFTPNGFVRSEFGGDGDGATFTLRPSLAALEPHKSKVTVITGLCNKSTSTKASHEDITRILTCKDGGGTYDATNTSIDHQIATFFGGKPLNLAVSWTKAPNWQSKLSWSAPGVVETNVNDSATVYKNLFTGFKPPTGGTPTGPSAEEVALAAQRQSVLDFVREDVTLFKGRLAAPEKARLDIHLDALRELEVKVGQAAAAGMCDPTKVSRATAGNPGSHQAHGELQMDLIATSIACGLKRSATLFWQGASGGLNPLGGTGHHNVSHGEAPRSVWTAIDKWYAERFAYLLKKLSDLQILDTTAVVWGTEISQEHNQNNFTYLLAGGSARGLKNGGRIALPFKGSEGGKLPVARDPSNASVSDLWVSVQKAMGINKDTFGDHSTGGLPGLFKA